MENNKKTKKAKVVKDEIKDKVINVEPKEEELVHCITTDAYQRLRIRDKELGYIPEANKELYLTKKRFDFLQHAKEGVVFVKKI